MFKWISSDRPAPEQLELEEKLRQLDEVEERYAEVQTEYVTQQNELSAFKLRYWRRVGPLYSKLDQVRAEIAAELARNAPRNPLRQQTAKVAGAQARASAESLHEAQDDSNSDAFEASDDLRRLYRQAARLVHPDRADDEDDRALRDEIMARINAAYRNGNGLMIESLLEEYQMRAETGEEDAATRLIRTIRTIARMRDQIRETTAALATLRDSELFRLQKIVLEAEAKGIDKLADLASGVQRQVAEAELRLERIRKFAAAKAAVPDEPVPSARTAQRSASAPEPKEDVESIWPNTQQPKTESEAHEGLLTQRGEKVERRAEQSIANQLNKMGLDYRYRQPLPEASALRLRVPDFTFRDRDKCALLWFHLAEIGDAAERERWQADLAAYADLGYEVGINLFVSREEAEGQFDEAKLHKMAAFVRNLVSE